MFRFIHTSDWHLGQNFYGYDRSAEQRDFLQQLAAIVAEQRPDALLVSGDVYHTPSPSNSAVSLYVKSMLDIHEACPEMAIIVIAGNHDSAARLESDSLLWRLAGVTVLGGIARNGDGTADLDRHLVRVGDKGIVAAVPFGYAANFPQIAGNTATRDQRQQAYFQALLDRAAELNPDGLPVALMAHLAVSGSNITGHDSTVLMDSVALNELGTGYDYAALGHIHHPQQLSQQARYCGTPLAVSFDEQCEHAVSLVEIATHGTTPVVSRHAIRNIRPLHTIPPTVPADFDSVMEQLQGISEEDAYVRLNVLVDGHLPHDAQTRAAQLLAEKHCRYCCIKRTLPATARPQGSTMSLEQLSSKSPQDVANQYFADKTGNPMSDLQRELFNEALQQVLNGVRS
ncbi:MAG: exonuclease SbcCD subunit D C-terminal domain-containing protein [Muribaculaceae bacterium]|nr:exonuclease SbcCD subunit D C-terminal domain-containing protein [Muribaculaceae bacterium]